MATHLSDDVKWLLLLIRQAGSHLSWDDDNFPIGLTNAILKEAIRDGYVRYSDGSFWEPTQMVTLREKGLRALGEDVPTSRFEHFTESLPLRIASFLNRIGN